MIWMKGGSSYNISVGLHTSFKPFNKGKHFSYMFRTILVIKNYQFLAQYFGTLHPHNLKNSLMYERKIDTGFFDIVSCRI